MPNKSSSKLGSFKKLTSGLLSGMGNSAPIELMCRFDGRIIEANQVARTLAKTLTALKINRLLPDDHFELVSRALHSGDVIVSANRNYGYDFEWKYFLDQRNKVIRIESIKYKENNLNQDGENITSISGENWSNLIDSIPVAVCVTENNSDEVKFINQLALRILNIAPGTENQTRLRDVFTDAKSIKKINELLIEQGFVRDLRVSTFGKSSSRWDNHEKWLQVNIKLIRKVEGSFLIWTFTDNTSGSQTEAALIESENKFQNVIQGAQEGIWEWQAGLEGSEWWSQPMYELLGLKVDECEIGLSQLQRLIHPDDRDLFANAWAKLITEKGKHLLLETRIAVKKQGYRWFVIRGTADYDFMCNAKKVVGSISDIHLQKQAQVQLADEKDKVVATLRSIVDAVITTNERGEVQYINQAASRFLNCAEEQAKGKHIEKIIDLYEEESEQKIENPILSCLSGSQKKNQKLNADIVTKAGTKYTVQLMVTPLISQTGKLYGAVTVMNDVTNLRLLARRLRYQASHDSLTSLINRSEFERNVRKAILVAKTKQKKSSLIYLDLDRFKMVNDLYGHAAGDELLIQFSNLVKSKLRGSDILARLGGDEFALLLSGCSLEEAEEKAHEILQSIQEYKFIWEQKSFNVEASIGVAEINQKCFDLSYVLSAVDSACYLAKEAGRNCVRVFREGDENINRRRGQERWLQRFDKALNEGRLVVTAQSIINIKANKNVQVDKNGFEILIRMQDDNGRLVPPNAFLPAVERYNRAPKLDRWILDKVLMLLAENRSVLAQIDKCSINLSGQSLVSEGFLPFTMAKLKEYEIEPSKICFEITETAAIANLDQATSFVQSLKDLGCYFALDDFGSGLSSFAYLKTLPVDFLKIDGMFVKDIHHDNVSRAMVKAINEMGHVLGKQTIAEYVENEDILKILKEIGVDFAQGFHAGRPEPILEFFESSQFKVVVPKIRNLFAANG
ncbi:MAG: EAL domain-containing protein [Gammaproteobacteria bacterium]|nr:EAL domain-containing protein [Gammaproteobacteria bacterium]